MILCTCAAECCRLLQIAADWGGGRTHTRTVDCPSDETRALDGFGAAAAWGALALAFTLTLALALTLTLALPSPALALGGSQLTRRSLAALHDLGPPNRASLAANSNFQQQSSSALARALTSTHHPTTTQSTSFSFSISSCHSLPIHTTKSFRTTTQTTFDGCQTRNVEDTHNGDRAGQ